jgi:hypothetical protein
MRNGCVAESDRKLPAARPRALNTPAPSAERASLGFVLPQPHTFSPSLRAETLAATQNTEPRRARIFPAGLERFAVGWARLPCHQFLVIRRSRIGHVEVLPLPGVRANPGARGQGGDDR